MQQRWACKQSPELLVPISLSQIHKFLCVPVHNFHKQRKIIGPQVANPPHLRKVRKSNILFISANLRIFYFRNLFAVHYVFEGRFFLTWLLRSKTKISELAACVCMVPPGLLVNNRPSPPPPPNHRSVKDISSPPHWFFCFSDYTLPAHRIVTC